MEQRTPGGEPRQQRDDPLLADDLRALFPLALTCLKERRAVSVLLCGDVTEDYAPFLTKLAEELYTLGILDSPQAEQRSLLSLLSGRETMDAVRRALRQFSGERRRLLYLSGFHQLEFDPRQAGALLADIQTAVVNRAFSSPLVLNIPGTVCLYVRDRFPALWNASVKYVRQPDARAQETRTESRKESRKESRADAPWYKKDLALLQAETNGMQRLLQDSDAHFALSSLPRSRRVCWSVGLRYPIWDSARLFRLCLVYSASFSRSNPAVGVCVENASERLRCAIRRSRLCRQVIPNDPECGELYLLADPPDGREEAAAATALNSFVALLDTLPPYDLL